MTADERMRVRDAIVAEHGRTARQVAALERTVTAIVEASELTSTDDEHDPEGATIAYERAQAAALLRQARVDLHRLDDALAQVDDDGAVRCASCAGDIGVERLLALPVATTCIACATSG